MIYPFIETHIKDNEYIRTFEPGVESKELVWHRDKENRLIEVIQSDDWWIQLDNTLPKQLLPNTEPFFIKARQWHRLVKGPTASKTLVIKIVKHAQQSDIYAHE